MKKNIILLYCQLILLLGCTTNNDRSNSNNIYTSDTCQQASNNQNKKSSNLKTHLQFNNIANYIAKQHNIIFEAQEIEKTFQTTLEYGALGQTRTLNNRHSKLKASITPINSYRFQSKLCRQFKYKIITDTQSITNSANACRDSQEQWYILINANL